MLPCWWSYCDLFPVLYSKFHPCAFIRLISTIIFSLATSHGPLSAFLIWWCFSPFSSVQNQRDATLQAVDKSQGECFEKFLHCFRDVSDRLFVAFPLCRIVHNGSNYSFIFTNIHCFLKYISYQDKHSMRYVVIMISPTVQFTDEKLFLPVSIHLVMKLADAAVVGLLLSYLLWSTKTK